MLVILFSRFSGTTTAKTELLVEPRNRSAQRPRVSKGAEVARAIILSEAGEDEAWPEIAWIDLGQEEAFVVPKAHIITRAVLLDELALKEERFLLVAYEVDLKIPDRLEESPCLEVGLLLARRHEIAGQPLSQVAGLPHVNHRAKAIEHEIDSRLVRDLPQTGSQVRTLCHLWTKF